MCPGGLVSSWTWCWRHLGVLCGLDLKSQSLVISEKMPIEDLRLSNAVSVAGGWWVAAVGLCSNIAHVALGCVLVG